MGLAIGGRVIPTPFRSVCYLEDARYRADPGSDLRRRAQGTRVRGIVLHATQGNPTFVNPGTGPADRSLSSQGLPPNAGAWFQVWRNSSTQSSAHIVVDWDGTVYCGADLLTEAASHATIVNEWTIGIELHVGFGDNDAPCGGVFVLTGSMAPDCPFDADLLPNVD